MISNARQLIRSLVGIYHWRDINLKRFGGSPLLMGGLGPRPPAPMITSSRFPNPQRTSSPNLRAPQKSIFSSPPFPSPHTFNQPSRQHHTDPDYALLIPVTLPNTKFGEPSFSYTEPLTWNNVPSFMYVCMYVYMYV